MNAVQTAPNGVINQDTIFNFSQEQGRVWASYAGGRVLRGFLVGLSDGTRLTFRYCQLETGNVLNGGSSDCQLRRNEAGLRQIVEHFQWESRAGDGINIIQEIPPDGIRQGTADAGGAAGQATT